MAVYSHSRLETFRKCPRQFYYRYIAKIPLDDAPEQIATFLGSRCHEALEYLYKQTQRHRVLGADELVAFYSESWKATWKQDVLIQEEGLTPSDYRKIGERCLRDYHRRHQPFDQARTVGLERQVLFPLDREKQYQLIGYIDRLAKSDDDVWQVHDYKTNKTLPTQSEKDADPQLAYYEIGIRQMWPDAERVELYWHFLRHDQTIKSTRTATQLEELRRETIDLIKRIEGRDRVEKAFSTQESALCDYCDYQHVCPVRKHLSEVRTLPPNRFAKETGVKLVDHWAELQAQRDALAERDAELRSEIDEVRAALLSLAEKKGLSTIVGTAKEVAVTIVEAVAFPTKGNEPEDYAAFEAKLRRSKYWPEVSTLNRAALKRLWDQQDELDTALCKILASVARSERQVSTRLRNRRG